MDKDIRKQDDAGTLTLLLGDGIGVWPVKSLCLVMPEFVFKKNTKTNSIKHSFFEVTWWMEKLWAVETKAS